MLCVASAAWADEPYVIDDAAILSPGTCQFEAGKRTLRGGRTWYLLPACNLIADVELTIGRTGFSGPGEDHDTANFVQAKGVWRALEANDYGLGWHVGANLRRHPREGARRGYDYFGTLIASRSFFDEKLIAHVNAGVRWLRDEDRGALAGGILGEWNVTQGFALLAEVFDTSRNRRAYQAGARFAFVPEHVILHLTIGGEAENFNATRYWTIGLHFISPPLK